MWDLDSLEAIMQETMELARLRAVVPASRHETVWIEDSLPEGATPLGDGEGWTWVRLHPEPLSGKVAHQSALVAGMHQHFFHGAKASLPVSVGDQLFAHVYLDPSHLPREVMLQWHDGTWEHRAYWGENLLDWGTDGTVSRWFMGPLPAAGQWVRLEVPAELVGLAGQVVSGMAFSLWDGRATWDRAGKIAAQPAGMAVAGKTAQGEVVLAAPEYLEGHLDWFSFVVRQGKSLGAGGDVSTATTALLPAPVTFRGMPSPRFWEFEDAKVNFAQVEAAPHDLARILLVKLALEYSNDWFVVPVEVAVGSLCRVRSLIVTNIFGERLLIPHTSQVDGAESPWRMFALTHDAQQLFFLPPVLGPSLQSPPVEEVLFLRDEMANVAWGVERAVESGAGRPLDRFEAYQEARQRAEREAGAANGNGQSTAQGAYCLGTSVPDYWIPLLPVQAGTSIRLQRGALPNLGTEEVNGVLEP